MINEEKTEITIFWFRRDLRLTDNAALYHALKNNSNVLPIFIFDKNILNQLENKHDKRIMFIYDALTELNKKLLAYKSGLLIVHDTPLNAFKQLVKQYPIKNIYTNNDYEPYAINRDNEIREFLLEKEISFFQYKDQVIFEKNEVVKADGSPYLIFTPYMRIWKNKLNDFYVKSYPCEKYSDHLFKTDPFVFPELKEIGFQPSTANLNFPSPEINFEVIKNYDQRRNLPAVSGTSRLSVHLRFGTISIRQLVKKTRALNDRWLNELIWREFYMMILFHFPHVAKSAFKKNYDLIKWRNNENEFKAWSNGETGYPIVDAGMRELNSTGFMHNRVRMITASFLVKHLLIDWRWGEAYFAEKLLDFDLSANNGGWQWAASSGCDAAPYFRIFNPYEQTKRFDANFEYIKKWVPEFQELTYVRPIVEHKFARERALTTYKKALTKA